MDKIYQNIISRRSCRDYSEQAVKQEDLELIMKAAIYAPSGMNKQSWQFTVIRKKEHIQELATAVRGILGRPDTYNFYNPNVIVLVSNDRENTNGLADCACALQNIFLMAHALGISSCWINQLKEIGDEPLIREQLDRFGIPSGHVVWGIAALGYARERAKEVTRNENVIRYVD